MLIGITGTREGMTAEQRAAVYSHVRSLRSLETPTVHHGGCVGVDSNMHTIFRHVFDTVKIVIHPASGLPERLCNWDDADELRDALPPLQRNRNIVDAVFGGVMFACPRGQEEQRSGTWATVRYARKARRGVVLFWPDGSMTSEGNV